MNIVFEEELPGLLKKNMSNRYYDIFMFEMTFHVCYATHKALGILQVVNCGSPSWTRIE